MDFNKKYQDFAEHLKTKGIVKIEWNCLGVITNLTREAGCSLGYNEIELMLDTWLAAKAKAVPEGYVLVPKEPTAEQYGELARDLVRYLQMCQRWSPLTLSTYLKRFGIEMPEWMKKEIPNTESDHHFAKGDIAALIYKAMINTEESEND